MSTKITISYGDDYHLYEECFDKGNIYIRLDNIGGLDVSVTPNGTSGTISIPIKIWRDIVSGWLKSSWADNPDLDNMDPLELFNPDSTIEWLSKAINDEDKSE